MRTYPTKEAPTRYCPVCGTLMKRKRFNGRLEDYSRFISRQTCSQTCGNSRSLVQANTHRWRARKIKHPQACEGCGTTSSLHVHHRDKDVTNNSLSNLVTLCASCHLSHHWEEDREERMRSISGHTRQPSSDGSRYLAGRLPYPLSPAGRGNLS